MERVHLESILSRLGGREAVNLASSFTEDGVLQLAGRERVSGRAAVGAALQDESGSAEKVAQRVTGLWEIPGGFVREATVTYRLRGGGEATVPEVAVVLTKGEQIRELRIYRDPAPLHVRANAVVDVRHEERGVKGAFFVLHEGRRVGELSYTVEGPHLLVIDHTEVGPELRGRNAGQRLVEAAVAWARQGGRRVLPVCPFARAMLERSGEDVVLARG